MSSCLRISMWSGPRNVSTATMYAFRQRSDTRVLDEPLYAHYLKTSGAPHPGREAVLAAQDHDGARVVREVLLGPCQTELLFIKNMAHHLRGLKRDFLGELRNILLIRNPRDMLSSLAEQLPEPTLDDTGLPEQVAVLEHILSHDESPVVLEAEALLANPEGVLREACTRLGIGFDRAMLSWPAGPKPEDGVWAAHWYGSVHKSTGFGGYHRRDLPERLEGLLEQCRPLYETLYEHAIRAPRVRPQDLRLR